MCDYCQRYPRIIDHKAMCCNNCGNMPLLQCQPDDPNANEPCDLWVPEDHFKYHDHYVSFITDDAFEGPWSGYKPEGWVLYEWIGYKFGGGSLSYQSYCKMKKDMYVANYKSAEAGVR